MYYKKALSLLWECAFQNYYFLDYFETIAEYPGVDAPGL